MAKILVVDDERSMREFLQILLQREKHTVALADDVKSAVTACQKDPPDLVYSDLKLPDGSGIEILRWVREHLPATQVIMLTAFGTTENAVEAMRLGAYDYQIKPAKVAEIQALTQKALEKATLIRDNAALRDALQQRGGAARIIGHSKVLLELKELIARVAPSRANILIEGESGSGKELVARALHEGSPRGDKPFVAINCGAIPETLLESEFFGHVAGAFTGAQKARGGLFEAADGGTLFLDEIGELPMSMQVKLLRVLQERSVRRVGGESETAVDVRIIAATNRDLQEAVAVGEFREDLFYRLNVVRLKVPALRERREDIALLARAFLHKYAELEGRNLSGIDDTVLRALADYPFPGNVRELENIIERAVTLADGDTLRLADLPDELQGASAAPQGDPLAFPEGGIDMEEAIKNVERRFIQEALARTGNVKTKAAELLGLSFRSLRYRLQKLELDDEGDEK